LTVCEVGRSEHDDDRLAVAIATAYGSGLVWLR
jgi:hypothetical protein